MTFYKEDLLRGACQTSGCSHSGEQLRFRPTCHADAGIEVLYRFATNDVVLLCKTCAAMVVSFGIGTKTLPPLAITNESIPTTLPTTLPTPTIRRFDPGKPIRRPKKKPKR